MPVLGVMLMPTAFVGWSRKELLCALALADARITVQHDHAMLQLGKADALADILADAGRHIRRAGQQAGGLLGGGLGLFIQLEELAQLPLNGFYRAFILLIEVAAPVPRWKDSL